MSQVWHVSEQLECGMVRVNEGAILSETHLRASNRERNVKVWAG